MRRLLSTALRLPLFALNCALFVLFVLGAALAVVHHLLSKARNDLRP